MKPKSSLDLAKSIDSIGDSVKQMNISGLPTTPIIPPNIDRKLKPSTPKVRKCFFIFSPLRKKTKGQKNGCRKESDKDESGE